MTKPSTFLLSPHSIPPQLTYNIGLQRFGYQVTCNLQILCRTFPHLQTTGHTHSLQHLDVIVDLKHVVEIKQILKPANVKE